MYLEAGLYYDISDKTCDGSNAIPGHFRWIGIPGDSSVFHVIGWSSAGHLSLLSISTIKIEYLFRIPSILSL